MLQTTKIFYLKKGALMVAYCVYLLAIVVWCQTMSGMEKETSGPDKIDYNIALNSLDNKNALQSFFERIYPYIKNKNFFDVYFKVVVDSRKKRLKKK